MFDGKCEIQNLNHKDLTVGSEFVISCLGTGLPIIKPSSTVEIRLNKEDQYKLKLLKFESSTEALNLKVTSYVVGDHHLKAVQVVDSENSIVLGDLNFTVQSVQNPSEPREAPYGPMGPIEFGMPLWYWILWATAILMAVLLIIHKIKKHRTNRKRIEEIRSELKGQEPYHYFNSHIRQMSRKYPFLLDLNFKSENPDILSHELRECVKELERNLRIYLGAQFQIPSLHLNNKKIVSKIEKQIPVSLREVTKEGLQQLFNEFAQFSERPNVLIEFKDCAHLFNQIRTLVDKLDAAMDKNKQKVRK